MADPQLMAIFDFTPEELALNQSQAMSARQAAQIKAEERDENISLLFGVTILGVVGLLVCGLCAFIYNVPVILRSISDLLLVGLGLAGLLILVVLWVNWQGNRERRKQAPVTTAAGDVDFAVSEGRTREAFYVIVDDLRLPVPEERFVEFQAFHQQQPVNAFYRIHYATHRKKILSAEVVGVIE